MLQIESKHFLKLCVAHIKYIHFKMFILKCIGIYLVFLIYFSVFNLKTE